MTTRDGNVIVELASGLKVGFRFDNWVWKETQRKTGSTGVMHLLHRIGIDDGNIDGVALLTLLVEAINEYNHNQKIDVPPIDERTVSDYIDQMGGASVALIKIAAGFDQYVPKNLEPPQMAGELTLQ
jgi:hypothetical protein